MRDREGEEGRRGGREEGRGERERDVNSHLPYLLLELGGRASCFVYHLKSENGELDSLFWWLGMT